MFLIPFYLVYTVLFTILVVFLSLNTQRIAKLGTNPRSLTLLFPLFINFIVANLIFRIVHPFLTTLIPCVICFLANRKLQSIRVFGVTGGTSTGKSTLIRMIKNNLKQVDIIDCQKIIEDLLKKDKRLYQIVKKAYGKECESFLDLETQQIQKQKFIDFLYQKVQNLNSFNRLISWTVSIQVIKAILMNIWHKKNLMVVQRSALSQNTLLQWICYPNVVILSEKDLQIKRAINKWSCPQNQAKQRLQKQSLLTIKLKQCQIFIQNKQSEQQLLSTFLTKINPYMRKNLNGFREEKEQKNCH